MTPEIAVLGAIAALIILDALITYLAYCDNKKEMAEIKLRMELDANALQEFRERQIERHRDTRDEIEYFKKRTHDDLLGIIHSAQRDAEDAAAKTKEDMLNMLKDLDERIGDLELRGKKRERKSIHEYRNEDQA